MKKRNGFTLIELLAVIVILSLIALIAIPLIMNVIESSKKGAYEESLRNLIKATEYYETSEEILGNRVDFSKGLSVLDNHIEMKNKNFKTGIIKKNEKGELYLENVSDGNYCGNGTIDKLTITKGECEGIEPPIEDTTFTFDSIMTDEKAGSNGSIHIDTYNNKRFAGSDPNNYVCFGIQDDACDEEHLYRIIGIIDGKIKIIKNSYYSTAIAWDTKGGANGSNDWERPADLKVELNGNGFYDNINYIDESHKTYIVNATWYIGGIAWESSGMHSISSFEQAERNLVTTEYIGLMSVTDFGYASNNTSCNKSTTNLYATNNACMSDNWLFDGNNYQWTITPRSNTTTHVWYVHSRGSVNANIAVITYGVRPSMFLDPAVKIKSGEGTSTKPYILT